MSVNDLKKKALIDKVGAGGSLPDLELKWLKGEDPAISTIPDGWRSYLTAQGFTGAIPDAQFKYFRDLGHEGSLTDMIRKFWLGGIPSGFNLIDVFATTLYTGNGGTQDIISDLDFTAKDGLVWIKARTQTSVREHILTDTLRGPLQVLNSDSTLAEFTLAASVTSFNADGVTIGIDSNVNQASQTYVAWQFMKQQGFFDIVEYTGDGIAGRTLNHDVGTFGMCIIKNRDVAHSWYVQHTDVPATQVLFLDLTNAVVTTNAAWNDTAATDSVITLGTEPSVNASSQNLIAYVFAHNPSKGIFCGSYTGTGAAGNKIVTGFPVGWLLVKVSSAIGDWYMFDVARGIAIGGNDAVLLADTTGAESLSSNYVDVDSDGFTLQNNSGNTNGSGKTYIFMAIADPSQL